MKKIIFFCLTALMLCSCGAYKRLAYNLGYGYGYGEQTSAADKEDTL